MTENDRTSVIDTLRATPTPVRYLLGGVLINQLGAFVQTFLVLYLTHRDLTIRDAGLGLVAYSAGTIFGTMLGGEATQRFGPRTTIMVAMAGSAPLVAVIPWLSRPGRLGWLLVVIALAGLLAQAYRPAAAVLLSDLMPERYHVMAFSMMRIALNTGAAVAPLIAAGLILVDWNALFWVDGATTLVYSALAFVLLPRRTAAPEEAPRDSQDAAEQAPPPVTGRAAYVAMLHDRRYMFYLFAVLLGTICYVQSAMALPLEVVADHYPTSLYSGVLTVSSLVLITCELKITTYITRLPTHIAVAGGHLVNSAGFAVYALAVHSPVFVLVGAVLAVSGLMIAGPSMFAHPATFPAALKARYIGTMQAVAGLASALGPLFGVFVWTRLGGGFWLLVAGINVAAGLLAMAGLSRPAEAKAGAEPRPGAETGPGAEADTGPGSVPGSGPGSGPDANTKGGQEVVGGTA
ncbi:MFS transporter [Streptomyces polygonati]|uniref:MFS transporter n=1 Tax=Streptomyces polygonati TaxID=1617087 RepID=A0ABV8HGU6_9ACTN